MSFFQFLNFFQGWYSDTHSSALHGSRQQNQEFPEDDLNNSIGNHVVTVYDHHAKYFLLTFTITAP